MDDATANHGADTAPHTNTDPNTNTNTNTNTDPHNNTDPDPDTNTYPDRDHHATASGNVLIPGELNGDADRFGEASDRLPPHPRLVPTAPHRPPMATVEVVLANAVPVPLAAAGVEFPAEATVLTREAIVSSSPVIHGSGEHHVLALHGWFGSARGWGPLPGYLDGSAYTYAFMDLRGYGDRKQATGQFTMAEAAADALALADELGWDRFSVIGHSMGAKAAHQVLLQAPDRVRRLVGVNPVPAAEVPMDDQTWGLFDGAANEPANRAAIIDFTTGNKLTKSFIDQVVRHSLENCTTQAFGAYLLSWAKSDFSGDVKNDLSVPVKVIVGETDPAMSAAVMEQTWLSYFPGAELEILPSAGHYPMFEVPVALATSVESFLGRE